MPSKNGGSGKPHIMCPMEKYISTAKNTADCNSRRFNTGVSRSASGSSPADARFSGAPFSAAP